MILWLWGITATGQEGENNMIISAAIGVVIGLLGGVLQWLPDVTTLPAIAGYNIDAALVSGTAAFYTFIGAVWPIGYAVAGFFVLMGYYTTKMILKFFLGHRAPGLH